MTHLTQDPDKDDVGTGDFSDAPPSLSGDENGAGEHDSPRPASKKAGAKAEDGAEPGGGREEEVVESVKKKVRGRSASCNFVCALARAVRHMGAIRTTPRSQTPPPNPDAIAPFKHDLVISISSS